MRKLIIPVLVICLLTPYFLNIYKFVGCDFESAYRCEAIHGIGVAIPPASFVTVWFSDDRPND